MHDGLGCAFEAFVGALDQLSSALHQHLNRHIIGYQIFFDELAHEIKIGLAGRRKTDFDFFESHLHQRVKHFALAYWIHGVDQGLVAVAQIDAAPIGGDGYVLIGPGAVRKFERKEPAIFLEWHFFRCHICWWHRGSFLTVAG